MGPRELLLLRHGRAEPGSLGADRVRPLTDAGKRDIQRVGVLLQARGWLPDATIASPAVRTHVTAEKSLKAGGRGVGSLTTDARIYDASLSSLLRVLATAPVTLRRVMLVGHNPGLSTLLGYLSDQPAAMQPGMLARVCMPLDWTALPRGGASLLDIVDPETLPRDFGFPGPDGPERRKRPAYYYAQSGVVPYRVHDGALEVLLVRSSKKKRWVVPKGIITPGLSPQASAAKEAREEAGVDGEVENSSLGAFTFKKWGAPVTCELYPMRVTRVLDDADWEERHRGREWVSAEEAIERLGRDGIKPLVRALVQRLR
ncbi:MAG: NUDIX domain-containing protein [Myxococcota bacterium]